MERGACAIAFASGRLFGRPIFIINLQRRAIPRPLGGHLFDLGFGHVEAVLDGIAAAVERALEADAVVGMAGDFLSPSVSFIDDRF